MTPYERQSLELLSEIRAELKQLNAFAPLLSENLVSVTEEYEAAVDEQHNEYDGPLPEPLNQSPVGSLT